MKKHKCFISFKTCDEDYKLRIQNDLGIGMIDKSLNEPINSENREYVMQRIRDEYLKDSSITIFLIGQKSYENLGDDQYYIKKELQASLYKSINHGRNGILGVVLPNMVYRIYKGKYTCSSCGNEHNYVAIDDNTVIKEFSANYYIKKDHLSCSWSEEDRYCKLVEWDDFVNDPNKYINEAWEKRYAPIANKIAVYPK
ncbi:TIR domain-containing protein [Lactobacillaceae bacterium Melli_B4]